MKICLNPFIFAIFFVFFDTNASFKISEEMTNIYINTYPEKLRLRASINFEDRILWPESKNFLYAKCHKKFPPGLPKYLDLEWTDELFGEFDYYSFAPNISGSEKTKLENYSNDAIQFYWLGYIAFLKNIEGKKILFNDL